MKKLSFKIFAITAAFIFFATCDKNTDTISTNSLNDLTGTYYGEYVSVSGQSVSKAGTVSVENASGSELSIHCLAEDLDTTYMVNAYDDGDSIMACDTSVDFSDDYHMSDHDHMMMSMDDYETDWMHHMEDAHDTFDIRFGGFSMTDHSFSCDFTTSSGDTLSFTGNKKL